MCLVVFQDSLHSLMATLSPAHPHFIRCIKPNAHKASGTHTHRNDGGLTPLVTFDPLLLMKQMRV